MDSKFIPLKILGKAAYLIGGLLVFNFFFGLLFLRFIYWILLGAFLLFFFSLVLYIGKNLLVGSFKANNAAKSAHRHGHDDIIDVEAEVFEGNQDVK
jgi:hypothetical protein